MLGLMVCICLQSATTVKVGDLYYELDGTTAKVIKNAEYSSLTEAMIPPSVTYGTHEYTVTEIDDNAFSSCYELLSVSIPSTVTYVGEKAFAYCTWLDSVAWNPVRMINTSYATNTFPFYNCKKITKFTFGETVQRIPAYLCYGLSEVKELRLPAGLQFVGSNAFSSMTGITEVVLPEGFNSMGTGIFSSCQNLASINIPSTLTSIGDYFCSNTALTEIDIPSTITTIGNYAFYATKLSSISIPESVQTVGNCAFSSIQSLTSVVWNPVRMYDTDYATNTFPFYNSKNITSFRFGENVQRIPAYLCYGLSGIASLEFPAGLQFIGKAAFYGLTQITKVVLPEGFNTMGASIFSTCQNLASINIPSTLTSIGDYFCYGTALTEIEIPLNITSIGSYAFSNTKISTITIPESVTNVGECAFSSCPNLTTVVWNAPNATSGAAVNTHPFNYCKLTSITFGEKVKTISQCLCYNQPTLSEIFNYSATPQTIKSNVFYNVYKSTCKLYVPKESLEDYKAAEVWKEFLNISGVLATLKFADSTTTITYLGRESADTLYHSPLTLHMPVAPVIEGFHFLKWEVMGGDLSAGIVLQAIYERQTGTDSDSAEQPSPLSRKLIREGKVYILRDDKLFTVTGARVE